MVSEVFVWLTLASTKMEILGVGLCHNLTFCCKLLYFPHGEGNNQLSWSSWVGGIREAGVMELEEWSSLGGGGGLSSFTILSGQS